MKEHGLRNEGAWPALVREMQTAVTCTAMYMHIYGPIDAARVTCTATLGIQLYTFWRGSGEAARRLQPAGRTRVRAMV